MGHREDLLEGAKRCLLEKGYGRTTARDIVAASGTNLASIGYHYGSTQALLNAALVEATKEWAAAAAGIAPPTPGSAPVRFEELWSGVIAGVGPARALWLSHFEAMLVAERSPELLGFLRDAEEEARLGLAAVAGADGEEARAVGSFYLAVLLGTVVQHLLDPERAPSAEDLVRGLRWVAGRQEVDR